MKVFGFIAAILSLWTAKVLAFGLSPYQGRKLSSLKDTERPHVRESQVTLVDWFSFASETINTFSLRKDFWIEHRLNTVGQEDEIGHGPADWFACASMMAMEGPHVAPEQVPELTSTNGADWFSFLLNVVTPNDVSQDMISKQPFSINKIEDVDWFAFACKELALQAKVEKEREDPEDLTEWIAHKFSGVNHKEADVQASDPCDWFAVAMQTPPSKGTYWTSKAQAISGSIANRDHADWFGFASLDKAEK